jgi:glycosyltransferase involved in cell wall biosynthesis
MGKKLLIIVYYWPPSGGAGVQRWLKLTKYLVKLGVECHVLTVDAAKASYMQTDTSLLDDVPSEIHLYRTNSFEPINLFAKFAGKKNVPTAGFSNVDNTKWKQKLINGLRSNLFIPDPRRGWNRYAFKKAKEIISMHNIENVLTTSPPHSSQLIGLRLKQRYKVNWVADLRDPWTDIYYYDILGHTFLSRKLDAYYEKKVLEEADQIFTVSTSIKNLFSSKSELIVPDKISAIPNGFDPNDFKNLKKESESAYFDIVYTGTIAKNYEPEVMIEAIQEVQSENAYKVRLVIVGAVSQEVEDHIKARINHFKFVNTVPHSDINQYQINADLLLLLIPPTKHEKGILTGKIFEYLATHNRIINLGPPDGDAAKIIADCRIGHTFDRSQKEQIVKQLKIEISYKSNNNQPPASLEEINKFSRYEQAKQISRLIFS